MLYMPRCKLDAGKLRKRYAGRKSASRLTVHRLRARYAQAPLGNLPGRWASRAPACLVRAPEGTRVDPGPPRHISQSMRREVCCWETVAGARIRRRTKLLSNGCWNVPSQGHLSCPIRAEEHPISWGGAIPARW